MKVFNLTKSLQTSLMVSFIATTFELLSGAPSRAFTPFDYFNDFTKYGAQQNLTCPVSPTGVCGAVAAINSFIFLQKQYPSIYDNKLVPNYNSLNNTSPVDALAFADVGWQVPSKPKRLGYYQRTGGAEQDYIETKSDWFNDFASGTSLLGSWFPGSSQNNRKPTIDDLAMEIKDGEDVEFFVSGTGFYHVLTLTGVFCTTETNCGIKYQDPNSPTNQYSTPVSLMSDMIMFTGVPGSQYEGQVTITAAFSESPIPVPGPLPLLGLGVAFRYSRKLRNLNKAGRITMPHRENSIRA